MIANSTVMYDGKKKKYIIWAILAGVLIAGVSVWLLLRAFAQAPEYEQITLPDTEYIDSDHVIRAAALSYFVYGCEGKDSLAGTVSNMLNCNDMGILTENYGIIRSDPDDPKTAMFDTSELIRRSVGDFRCLCCLKDEKSSFYGAAFCDDAERCVWIVYAGAISFPDYLACLGLVAAPDFTAQEKAAFALFDTVIQCDEVEKQSYGICLTGHSLGGALAAEVSLASGCPAITVNGADGLAYDKITGISGKKPEECRAHNYVTLPDGLSPMECVQRLMFLGSDDGVSTHLFEKSGYTSDTHCALSFLRFKDDDFTKPELPSGIDFMQ